MTLGQEISHRIQGEKSVRFAFLFGSQVTGRSRQNSDIDIAAFLNEQLSAKERFDVRLRLYELLSDLGEIDIVVLNEAPPLLAHRALLGERLFVHNRAQYIRFFLRSLQESEDERYYRDIHRNARAKRLREGSFGRP